MELISNDNLLSALNWRYAVKKFDDSKKLSTAQWDTLQEALVLTPSSYGLQPWRFIVVTNPEVRKQLTPASWGQPQVEDCSHFVVFAAKNNMTLEDVNSYVALIAKVRGVSAESLAGYRDMMVGGVTGQSAEASHVWASKQCYIALGNLMTSAAAIGVDVCPMEGIEATKYNQILQTDKLGGYSVVVAAAVGFRSAEDGYAKAKKVRFPAARVVIKI